MMRPCPTLLGVATLLSACAPDSATSDPDHAGVTIRDSAGVRIVENHDSAWNEQTRWRLADEPDLRIGSQDGGVPGTDWGGHVDVQTFGERIVVTDFMSTSVRIFDAEGTHIRTLDLQGNGPYEVQRISDVASVGTDSIAVWSSLRSRMLRLELASGVGTSYGIETDVRNPRLVGWFDDDSYILAAIPTHQDMEVGRHVVESAIDHIASDGTRIGRIATLPVAEWWKVDERVWGSVVFAATGWTAVDDAHVWHAYPAGQAEVGRIDPASGMFDRIVRLPLHPLPVEPAWVDRAKREMRAQMEPQQYADSTASIGQFFVAEDGALWITPIDIELIRRQNKQPEGTDLLEWFTEFVETWQQPLFVVDSAGRWLGTMELPPKFSVAEFGGDYLLGTRDDEFGVPYVERYRIIKPK